MPFKTTSVMPDLVTGKGRATLVGDDRVTVVITNLNISGLDGMSFGEAEKKIQMQAHAALKGAEAAFSALMATDDDALSREIDAVKSGAHLPSADPRRRGGIFGTPKPRR